MRSLMLAQAAKLELDAALIRYNEALMQSAWSDAEDLRVQCLSHLESWLDLIKAVHMGAPHGAPR